MTSDSEPNPDARTRWTGIREVAPGAIILVALLVRLAGAYSRFLNADEAMHYLFSLQPSLVATYRATLWTAHPPLLLILVHYWSLISNTEFFLRLPSVIAGTAAGWFLYAWLRRVADSCTAVAALALFLFSPALIYLSFEVRQYALLMMFMTASLYFLDRALMDDSAALMLAGILALYLALCTHYCALIFSFCAGCYALLRIWRLRSRVGVTAVWAAGQAGGVAMALIFWKTHITYIRGIGMVQHVAESYLRASLFQRGEENALHFILRSNIRVFRFLFSQGAIAVFGMLLFFAGIAWLLREGSADQGRKPTARQLGLLLLLPFLVNCIAALAGAYPYGASRHNSYLAIFAMPAIASLVARWKVRKSWVRPVSVGAVLAICNFTIAPAGAYIPASHQKKAYMRAAADWVRASVPPHSLILADYESGLLAGYYVCHKNIVQTVPPYRLFLISGCGDYAAATLIPPLWVFNADMFPEQMRQLKQTLTQDHKLDGSQEIWLFQAGYIVDKEPKFRTLLSNYGCVSPRQFGPNILVCRISLNPQ